MANETVQPKHVGKDQYEAGIVDCEPEQFASSWGKQVPLAPKKVGSFMMIEHKEEPKKPKKVFVILNPHGGFGQGKKAWESVAPMFEKAGIECVVQRTEFGGHATQLAKSLPLEQYDAILAIGGDGTIHEIINGLLNREDKKTIPLGLIPGGTGNSVLTSMEVDSPAYAAEAIINGHIVNIDLAKCTWAEDAGPKSCYSINLIGWGLAADCNARAEKLRIFGNQRYNVGIVWEILKSTDRLIRMEIDGEIIERNFTLAMILNNQHAGRDLNIAPFAKLDDGLLDLVLLDKFGRSQTLVAFGDLQKSTHIYRHDGVEYRRVRKVTLHTQRRDEITIDGENCAHTPITVEVVPAVLPIFFHPPAVHAERQAAKS